MRRHSLPIKKRNLTARNYPPSKWLLGRMNALGEGVERNPRRAAELFTEAVSAGFTFSSSTRLAFD